MNKTLKRNGVSMKINTNLLSEKLKSQNYQFIDRLQFSYMPCMYCQSNFSTSQLKLETESDFILNFYYYKLIAE